jgi:hypothetical protein
LRQGGIGGEMKARIPKLGKIAWPLWLVAMTNCSAIAVIAARWVALSRNSEVEARFFVIAQNDKYLFVILNGA